MHKKKEEEKKKQRARRCAGWWWCAQGRASWAHAGPRGGATRGGDLGREGSGPGPGSHRVRPPRAAPRPARRPFVSRAQAGALASRGHPATPRPAVHTWRRARRRRGPGGCSHVNVFASGRTPNGCGIAKAAWAICALRST